MHIRIRQEDDRRCTIRPPASLTDKIMNFLLTDESCKVSHSSNAAAMQGTEPDSGERSESDGYIDCHIKRGSMKELVLTIAEKFNFRVQSESGNDWTLVNKEQE